MDKILVVDDDPDILRLLEVLLKTEGYGVFAAGDGKKAESLAKKEKPDLVLLDIMLPGQDGFSVCQSLRRQTRVPIIMLTSRTQLSDKLTALETGADDYITKPFEPMELLARVRAGIRRAKGFPERGGDKEKEQVLKLRNITMNFTRHEVFVSNKKVYLTPKEFDVLRLFMGNPGKVFPREYLIEKIWGVDSYADKRAVDVCVKRVREKLGKSSLLQTVWGVGYKLESQ